ncbi:MAG: hypothetical protein GTO45_32260 [Candidatus Aminicenantes bacterium]|nr:hypothetical protein [Candidatus Aminicenantes bacterium]NIM83441.1 hypothetical protein [Candidatus Aminicenantes bacterium]NIN22816.1 hypothetical protein [Candidatus Aminicenantes bacterium]NIN46550.1 hypothetical protein [Candidatus Aminicenantes bacterium]NIN89455.1 hypothetical protein [Candidatus Aminicenantes bacterium]
MIPNPDHHWARHPVMIPNPDHHWTRCPVMFSESDHDPGNLQVIDSNRHYLSLTRV